MADQHTPDDDARPADRVPRVTEITADRAEMELRLVFDDGTAGTVGLMELRLHCPCATCRSARQQGREGWPLSADAAPLALETAELVGAWGLGVTWNDGHATGIYPFDSLHAWIVAGRPVMTPDSGLDG